ncbi:MAG: hypothetical protein R3246_10535 [Acidimicrobiia bacterium]|nr:hypothetical protein [Acidimicrobiia bacterium]
MADELAEALVFAYRPHVERRLAERGLTIDVSPAIDAGEQWLAEALADLLDRPFSEQSRGPLEVFQEAMRFPTAALSDAGVEPVDRDEVTANALPGDVYDLAPASSRDLGEEVWRAHLLWGARKARALGDRG